MILGRNGNVFVFSQESCEIMWWSLPTWRTSEGSYSRYGIRALPGHYRVAQLF